MTYRDPSLSPIPAELLLSILTFLDFQDIVSVSSSCRFFRAVASSIIFRNLKLGHQNIPAKDVAINFGNLKLGCSKTPAEEIRESFGSGGSLCHVVNRVRHVTLHSHNLIGIEAIVVYFRTYIPLLSLFPNLVSLKITRAAMSPLHEGLRDFDDKLMNAIFYCLGGVYPFYQKSIKQLWFKTAEYIYRDGDDGYKLIQQSSLSIESRKFLHWNMSKTHSNEGQCPASVREAFVDVNHGYPNQPLMSPMPGYVPDLSYLSNAQSSLKRLGMWINLQDCFPSSAPIFKSDLVFHNVTELCINTDFFPAEAPEEYLNELGWRFPNVEKVVMYLDWKCHDYVERERMYRYGSLVKLWPGTLKEARLPWLTYFGGSYETRSMASTVHVWIGEFSLNALEKVVFVREISTGTGWSEPIGSTVKREWEIWDEMEAIDCHVVCEEGRERTLVWGEVYRMKKLELDGYVVPG
ncbi:hypothetical protein AA313_de0207949 [Arthrobotrys entomopaga]|nr:hypothetical protein AA313_de0207949 [Arthrobotrys entomopaga]